MYLNNQFSEDYVPSIMDVYRGEKVVDGKMYDLEIHDTNGDIENFQENRQA